MHFSGLIKFLFHIHTYISNFYIAFQVQVSFFYHFFCGTYGFQLRSGSGEVKVQVVSAGQYLYKLPKAWQYGYNLNLKLNVHVLVV